MTESPSLETCPAELVLERALLGELAGTASAPWTAHLARCPNCASRLAEMRNENRAYLASSAARHLRQRLAQADRGRLALKPGWPRKLLLVAAPLAVAATLLIVLSSGRDASQPFRAKGTGALLVAVEQAGAVTSWDGSPLSAGQRAQLLWSSASPGYLAVFARAASGEISLLFPMSGDQSAPVAAGRAAIGGSFATDGRGARLWSFFATRRFALEPLSEDLREDRPFDFTGQVSKLELPADSARNP